MRFDRCQCAAVPIKTGHYAMCSRRYNTFQDCSNLNVSTTTGDPRYSVARRVSRRHGKPPSEWAAAVVQRIFTRWHAVTVSPQTESRHDFLHASQARRHSECSYGVRPRYETHLCSWRFSARNVLEVGVGLKEALLLVGDNLVKSPIRRLRGEIGPKPGRNPRRMAGEGPGSRYDYFS